MEFSHVVVTGGAGFIGSHAAEFFAQKADRVTVLDNLSRGQLLGKPAGFEHTLACLKKHKNITVVNADVRRLDEIRPLLAGADAIIHTAGQTAVTTSLVNPLLDFEINALGTLNVLEAARLADSSPAIITCSTNKVYGENVHMIGIREGDTRYEFDPEYRHGVHIDFPIDRSKHTPYGCSKLTADLYTQDYGHLYNMRTGVFRMSCVFGTRQFGVEDQGWIAWFVIASLLGRSLTIYGDGKQVRDVLWISDLLHAYDLYISSNIKQAVFNIGGGAENVLSLLDLLDLIRKETGITPAVSYADWRQSDQKVYVSDNRRIESTLGWKPTVTPEQGVRMLIDWVKANKKLFAGYDGDK